MARNSAGLVVQYGVAAIDQPLDPVGNATQLEHLIAVRNLDLTANFRMQCRHIVTPLNFPAHKPARDTKKARPPERARLRIVGERSKLPLAKRDQLALRIVRQKLGELSCEFAHRS